ncbi:hypothetical protein Vadar_008413 [Vaccinium darrowii]|uniref:Uncharacterized protein n=1 Tax=Vaccinium darrowii TaxID=229202 RepID=A0ACB7ZJ61_9ERIC|nr:hypothetical protein Vadar_008413 [Vaccinium darrowii]
MHTLFVDYLPEDVGILWFRNFFSNFGSVKDSVIPMKRSRISGCNFGFIRYEFEEEAQRAIVKANGLWIDNRRLVVKIANYDKKKEPRKDCSVNSMTRVEEEEGSFRKVESSKFHAVDESMSVHKDQLSEVPKEAQSFENDTEDDPKFTQDLESFVEDSMGLQSLFLETHVVESMEKRKHDKLLDVNSVDASSIDKADSGGSDYEDEDVVPPSLSKCVDAPPRPDLHLNDKVGNDHVNNKEGAFSKGGLSELSHPSKMEEDSSSWSGCEFAPATPERVMDEASRIRSVQAKRVAVICRRRSEDTIAMRRAAGAGSGEFTTDAA